MPFEFIDNSHINRKSRKVIRSHAAKTKGVSKVPIQHKRPTQPYQASRTTNNNELLEQAQAVVNWLLCPPLERQFSDSYAVTPFPVEMDPRSRGLVQKFLTLVPGTLCPPELAHAIDPAHADSIWVRFIFMDEAYLHATIAISIAIFNLLENAGDGRGDCEDALHRLQQALKLVNSRLSGEEATADQTMAAIIGLSQYERVRGRHGQNLVHLDGLQRIVELRGGISRFLQDTPAIAQKLFRADIEQALFLGLPTRFNVTEVPGKAIVSWLRDRSGQSPKVSFSRSRIFAHLMPHLQEAFLDLTAISWFLNGSSGQGIKLLGYTFHDLLIYVGYSVVGISPLISRQHLHQHEDGIHLGLLAFLATFLLPLGRTRLNCPLLIDVARSAAQTSFDQKKESQQLLFWLLFICEATIFAQEEDLWLVPTIKQAASTLKLRTWEDACEALSKFPWIRNLHGKHGASLWNRSMCLGKHR